ncbi:hypothetical protein GCM10022222_39230 [Amycolatopsis ultiminotia]|uniref:Transposase n=1 Tax=Amycolatopsis ultiminotia TaxID=543629 RepID=A0ABP6WM62_9PSEU
MPGRLTDKQIHRLRALFAVEEHVEAEATWPGTGNGPTEAINGRLEPLCALRRGAHRAAVTNSGTVVRQMSKPEKPTRLNICRTGRRWTSNDCFWTRTAQRAIMTLMAIRR